MNLASVLANLRTPETKTAAVVAPVVTPKVEAGTNQDLINTIKEATALVKTAAEETSPARDLTKMASELATAEQAADVKIAQIWGTAFADAAVARLAEGWSKVAAASSLVPADPVFGKYAAENPDLIKEAYQAGYPMTQEGIEKFANDQYVAEYNKNVQLIHKLASDEFLKGAAVCNQVLAAISG